MRGEQAVSRDGRDVEMLPLIERLYPLCRSITGDGVRESLKILQEYIPLKLHEVATGTPAFDWSVPQEWNIRQAYIATMTGERVVDFADHNLHIVHYSPPMDRVVALEELRSHLHTIAERPDWIPYRTSYYAANWGFCVTQRQFDALTDDRYRVVIDSSLSDGSLTYGELTVPGKHDETVLISTHICHPSLANDNLSGVVVATALASRLRARGPRYTYRFLFAPGTIGSLTWLALNSALGGADKAVPTIGAVAGVWVAGTLVAGLLFEGWPSRLAVNETAGRLLLLASAAAVAVDTQAFNLPNLSQAVQDAQVGSIDLLRDVDLNVKIELGRARMLVEDVLKLGEGSVVELDKLAGDPVDVFVNDRLVARGEVLVLNDNFCVRINEIVAGVKEEGL